MTERPLHNSFFDRPVATVAKELVGKVLRRRVEGLWLSAAIVEAEAYGDDKASHSYLGYSPSRASMWAPPGTIYMYHSRGGASLNFSTSGAGHAVLIKSARPWLDHISGPDALEWMHDLNPGRQGRRADHKLLSGQGLLTRALALSVANWDGKTLKQDTLWLEDTGYTPETLIKCPRLGIPTGRDEGLHLRFVDAEHVKSATQNPLTKRAWVENHDFVVLSQHPG